MCVVVVVGWVGVCVGEVIFCCIEGIGEGNGVCGLFLFVDGNFLLLRKEYKINCLMVWKCKNW